MDQIDSLRKRHKTLPSTALHDAPELLDRHDRAGEIARQVAWSERLFEEAERLITAYPIGTQELIVRAGTSRPPSPGFPCVLLLVPTAARELSKNNLNV